MSNRLCKNDYNTVKHRQKGHVKKIAVQSSRVIKEVLKMDVKQKKRITETRNSDEILIE